MRRNLITALLLSVVAATSAVADEKTGCLDNGPFAIAPFEALKLALIERREAEMFDALDPTGLFRETARQQIIGDLSGAAGDRAVVWCTMLQRRNYSEAHSGEMFMIRYAPDLFIYFATYAVRQTDGWVAHSISFNSDFAEMREHLR